MMSVMAVRSAAYAARAAAVATRAAVGSQPRRFYQAPQKDMDFVVNETYNHKHPLHTHTHTHTSACNPQNLTFLLCEKRSAFLSALHSIVNTVREPKD
jgi:hypothetical protein